MAGKRMVEEGRRYNEQSKHDKEMVELVMAEYGSGMVKRGRQGCDKDRRERR